jgi:hypothetical protein
MAKVVYVPPAPPVVPKRDINFTSQAEAMAVANSFLTIGGSPDTALTTDITVVALVPEAPNTNPTDGRLWHQIQFTRTMNVTNDVGRKMDESIPFDLNAGILLDDEVNNPLLPWVYLQSGVDGARVGDIERSDGH